MAFQQLLYIRMYLPVQVYEILARTVYGKRKRAEVGVARLLNEGAFKAAFPLHDVREQPVAWSDISL